MMPPSSGRLLLATLLVVSGTSECRAQALERRIASAAGSAVQFTFAAREGVCGDGRSYLRLDPDSWFGTMNDYTRAQPCEAGPARVVVVKSGTETIRLETYAGPLTSAVDAVDLGRVSAGDAVAYLGALATRGEGRVARDALLPLGIADSASVSSTFLALVRDGERPREVRRSALGWLVRRRTASDAIPMRELLALVSGIARNDSEQGNFRQSAVGMLGRMERGEGIPMLIEMSRVTGDPWLARQSTEVLSRNGDPRARRAIREIVADEKSTVEVRAVALSGLAGEYASSEDAETLMRLYPTLTGDRMKDAALSGIGNIGGQASRRFLLGIVKDEQHPARQRRKAASLLERAGVPVREVIASYDAVSDGEVRVQLIELLAQAGTRDATAKLVDIAKSDTQPNARRRAIAVLGRSEDASAREALRGLIGQ